MITSPDERRYVKNGTLYEIVHPDIFTYASIGDTEKVLAEISKDSLLLTSVDELKRTALYLTSRGGFYDTVKAILEKGARVDQRQADDSTSLHVASFYGQSSVVKLLLIYGADPSLKNIHGNTPVDEASEKIKQIFEGCKNDPTSVILSTLDLGENKIHSIRYEDKIIGWEVVRGSTQLNKSTSYQWDRIHRRWELAFHGTRYNCIESIWKHGLLASGSKIPHGEEIKPPDNHYQLGETIFGVDNWANAVFVSPNILYASHACYSRRIFAGDSQLCVIIKAFVEPASYKSAYSTLTTTKQPVDGEPSKPEYRCRRSGFYDQLTEEWGKRHIASTGSQVKESETSRNVVVYSVLFVASTFFDNVKIFVNYLVSTPGQTERVLLWMDLKHRTLERILLCIAYVINNN